MAFECSTSNRACGRIVENTALSKMVPKLTISLQTKNGQLLSVVLKVLSGCEVIRTQGKCIKSYKNFWKDFVVDFGSYLNRPYEIVVVWDDWTTGRLGIWIPANTLVPRSLVDEAKVGYGQVRFVHVIACQEYDRQWKSACSKQTLKFRPAKQRIW